MSKKYIKSYVSRSEQERIASQASLAGLSVSNFIKRACLAQEIRSVVDQEAILTLLQAKADLGRLGGLLKFHLGQPEGQQATHEDLRDLLKDIEFTKNVLSNSFNRVAEVLLRWKV